jgi:hypothetical protein
MNSENPILVICEIPKIYTPKPKRMTNNFSKNFFFNYDIDSLIENNENLELQKNEKSNLDSYSFEEIEKDFNIIKEKREELKKKNKRLSLNSTNRRNQIKRPSNPFYKNFE